MRPLPFIIILLALNHIAFAGCRVTVTLYAISLKASALTVGTLMALNALLPALLSVATGRWIDRQGISKPMLIGSAGVGLGTLLPFLLPHQATLYFTCIIVGLSFMFINVAVYHAVGEMSPAADRPVNFSYVALGFSISTFIAPLLSGVMIDHLGHRITFFILALFTLLPVIALSAKLLPDTRHHRAAAETGQRDVFDLLKKAELRRLFLIVTIISVAWDVYSFAIPIHGSNIGLSASAIGIVMGAFAAATFVVRLIMPFLATQLKPWPLLAIALLLTAISYLTLPFTTGILPLMGLMFLLGLGLGAPQPMVLTLLHHEAPVGRAGEALGFRTTLINSSQTVMPLIFGAVGTALGLAPLFWSVGLVALAGSAIAKSRKGQ
ncbi:MAG: MFS transporter [Betaproteobacteria bacterium]|nr:MFS transporter [Betaproteobacteria bacterium]